MSVRCSYLLGSVLIVALVAAASGCGGGGGAGSTAQSGKQIGAVIKGLDNPFFQTMDEGVLAAARRHGVRVTVSAAAGLQDTAGQASALESLVAQQAGCYLVNPISSANLIPSLAHVPKGTPIVNIDSPVDAAAAGAAGVHIKSYIGTDNVAAGKLAADAMARFVGPGDRVAVISGIPGDATSGARTRGFRQGTRGRFTVVESVAADFDRARAAQATDEVLRSDPRIRGVFAVNDEMALGVADTVRRLAHTGRIAVIGLDGIRDALDAIRLGKVSATVAQYPFAIGELGIEACVAALHGQQLPARVGAPIQLITRSNVARALARFPQPVSTFNDPLARLLRGG